MVQSLTRAFKLLEIIAMNQPIGISEMARTSSLKKPTVIRLLTTLRELGMVKQDPSTKAYYLSIRVFELGSRALDNLDLRRMARQPLEEFVNEHQVSVLLGVLDALEVIYIDKVSSNEIFRISTTVGGRAPAHCSAVGKAMLAFITPVELDNLLSSNSLKPYTDRTITDKKILKQELDAIKVRGFSSEIEEKMQGLSSVGAPVFDHDNRVIGAVSCPRNSAATSPEDLIELGHKILDLGLKISRLLGWSQP